MTFDIPAQSTGIFPARTRGWVTEPDYLMALTLEQLIAKIPDPRAGIILKIYTDHADLFHTNPGSGHNHQAWPGGLADHYANGLRRSWRLFDFFEAEYAAYGKAIPFTLGSAQVAWFCHDAEKLIKYAPLEDARWRAYRGSIEQRLGWHAICKALLAQWESHYGFTIQPEEWNAIDFAHAESDATYNPRGRAMLPLASFIHCIDNTDARMFFDCGQGLG